MPACSMYNFESALTYIVDYFSISIENDFVKQVLVILQENWSFHQISEMIIYF